jgi:putative peptide zinc metalloprotease protein
MSAFVRSVLPVAAWKGRKLPPLKPWAKVVFGAYTVITIPLLLLVLILMLRSVPRVLGTAWDSFGQQGQAFLSAQASGDLLGMLGSASQALLLAIPSAGLVYTLVSIGRRLVAGLWRFGQPSLARRAISGVCYVVLGGLLSFMWIPQVSLSLPGNTNQTNPSGLGPISPVSWEPIGADEPGRIQDVVAIASPRPVEPTPSPRPAVVPTSVATPQSRGGPDVPSGTTTVVPTGVATQGVATQVPPVITESAATPARTATARATPTAVGVYATSTVARATPAATATRATFP